MKDLCSVKITCSFDCFFVLFSLKTIFEFPQLVNIAHLKDHYSCKLRLDLNITAGERIHYKDVIVCFIKIVSWLVL